MQAVWSTRLLTVFITTYGHGVLSGSSGRTQRSHMHSSTENCARLVGGSTVGGAGQPTPGLPHGEIASSLIVEL